MGVEQIDLNEIDAGVRDVVRALRAAGFETTDSGDGSKYPAMGCALPYANVAIALPDDADLFAGVRIVGALLVDCDPSRDWRVEGSWCPQDPSGMQCVIFCTSGMAEHAVACGDAEHAHDASQTQPNASGSTKG